jgi:hypothetical protein
MENSEPPPTPEDAAAALVEAEASRTYLAGTLALPSFFYLAIGAAVAVQIATAAFGGDLLGGQRLGVMAEDQGWALAILLGGVALFVLVATTQLLRFRQLNGVWLGGLASRVVLGTAPAASISYAFALGGSIWGAFNGLWWLVALCAVAGGAAYALSGQRWWRRYQGDPASHSRGESAGWLAILGLVAIAGLVLLVLGR